LRAASKLQKLEKFREPDPDERHRSQLKIFNRQDFTGKKLHGLHAAAESSEKSLSQT
jgi:hypothetical protein